MNRPCLGNREHSWTKYFEFRATGFAVPVPGKQMCAWCGRERKVDVVLSAEDVAWDE